MINLIKSRLSSIDCNSGAIFDDIDKSPNIKSIIHSLYYIS